ncbi:MAG: response regulator [Deltaproteobacteria bacterium]|nr:response regulator [Deltaproteobacteria bacterium]
MRKKSGSKGKAAGIGKTILLVDEESEIALHTALQREGYRVFSCESPQTAWGLAYSFRPDFVIVHLHQPSARDVARLQECRALADGVPVIVATATPGYETIVKALEEGATAFLFLPIKPRAIRKVLDGLAPPAGK